RGDGRRARVRGGCGPSRVGGGRTDVFAVHPAAGGVPRALVAIRPGGPRGRRRGRRSRLGAGFGCRRAVGRRLDGRGGGRAAARGGVGDRVGVCTRRFGASCADGVRDSRGDRRGGAPRRSRRVLAGSSLGRVLGLGELTSGRRIFRTLVVGLTGRRKAFRTDIDGLFRGAAHDFDGRGGRGLRGRDRDDGCSLCVVGWGRFGRAVVGGRVRRGGGSDGVHGRGDHEAAFRRRRSGQIREERPEIAGRRRRRPLGGRRKG